MNTQKQDNKQKGINNFIRYSSLGFEMAVIIGIGALVGYKIDQWMENDAEIFTIILIPLFVILSILYGIRNLLKK